MDVIKDHFNAALKDYEESGGEKYRKEAAELAMILLVLDRVHHAPSIPNPYDHDLPTTFDNFADLAEEELAGATKYHSFYKQSGDDSYKQLAKQELSHAAFFIDKAKAVAKTPEQSEHIKSYKRQHDELAQALPAR